MANSKKADRFYNRCNKFRHLEEAFFKDHGYPEWFKKLQNQRKEKVQTHVNLAQSDDSAVSLGRSDAKITPLI